MQRERRKSRDLDRDQRVPKQKRKALAQSLHPSDVVKDSSDDSRVASFLQEPECPLAKTLRHYVHEWKGCAVGGARSFISAQTESHSNTPRFASLSSEISPGFLQLLTPGWGVVVARAKGIESKFSEVRHLLVGACGPGEVICNCRRVTGGG